MLRLPSNAVMALREHGRVQLGQRLGAGARWVDGDHIFTTGHGTPLHARDVTRWLAEALTTASLPHQRFHDLRHVYATPMIEAGEELVVVSPVARAGEPLHHGRRVRSRHACDAGARRGPDGRHPRNSLIPPLRTPEPVMSGGTDWTR